MQQDSLLRIYDYEHEVFIECESLNDITNSLDEQEHDAVRKRVKEYAFKRQSWERIGPPKSMVTKPQFTIEQNMDN